MATHLPTTPFVRAISAGAMVPRTHVATLVLLYAVTFTTTWWLSAKLEVIEGVASWFLPAGVRVTALLITHVSRWHWLWFTEVAVNAFGVTLVYEYQSVANLLIGIALPFGCYAMPIAINGQFRRLRADTVPIEFLAVSIACAIGGLLNGLVIGLNLFTNGVVSLDELPRTVATVCLGDMVGISLALALLAFFLSSPLSGRKFGLFVTCLVFSAGTVLLVDLSTFGYFFKFAFFIPLLYVTAALTLEGAGLGVLCITTAVLTAKFLNRPLGSIEEDQFYVIALSLTFLALAELARETQRLNTRLSSRNEALSDSLEALQNLSSDRQSLARRLVSVEEDERARFSRELHDGLGQLVSSARMQLGALQRSESLTHQQSAVKQLDDTLAAAYTTSKDLINQLTPTSLRYHGLVGALQGGEVRSLLQAAGMALEIEADEDLSGASEALMLTVYRIVQEAASNAARHSKGTRLLVRMTASPEYLAVSISDNGQGFDPGSINAGQGLTNIRDRVTSNGGAYELHTGPEGTRHRCRLKWTPESPPQETSQAVWTDETGNPL